MAEGLLDFIKTPEGQGLLSTVFGGLAGAQRGAPLNSLGRAGMAGVMGYGNALERQYKLTQLAQTQKLQNAQIDNYQSEAASRRAALEKQTSLMKMLQGDGSPSDESNFLAGQSALSATAAGGGQMGPTNAAASIMRPMSGAGLDVARMSPAQQIMFKANGLDVADIVKNAQPDMQVQNGYAFDKKLLKPGFMPGLSTSSNGQTSLTTVGADGQPTISSPKGAVDTFLSYKAGDKPQEISVADGSGRSFKVELFPQEISDYQKTGSLPSRYNSIGIGGQQTMQPIRNQGNAMVGNDIQSLIRADAEANGINNPTMNINAPKAGQAMGLEAPKSITPYRPSDAPKLTLGLTQDPAIAEREKVDQSRRTSLIDLSNKASIERIYASYDSARNASDALVGLNESRKSIAGGVYSGAGADVKLSLAKGIQAITGISVDAERVSNTDYLQSQLGSGILAKAKTLGANPTDNDARIIKQIVGSIGTDPQALNKLIDYQEKMYLRSISSHNDTYTKAKSGGFEALHDLTIAPPKFENSQTVEPKLFNMLPPASQFSGKRMEADNGTRYKSNGRTWVKE